MKKSRLEIATVAVYVSLLACFTLFMAYMGCFERNEIFSARDFGDSQIVQTESERVIADDSAPVGIRREFTWTMPECHSNESCLVFYLVHHYAEVRFDGELIYSLSPGENNRIGNSPSSNWVMIPIDSSDSGRQVTVTVTPVYSSVANRQIVFEIGSRYSILMNHLKTDFPQILLAAACILMGLVLAAAQLYLALRKKVSHGELLYLGIFILLIGLWRITDTQISPILFPWNPMVLGYLTIGALLLICTPILLYFKSIYRSGEKPLVMAALLNCVVAMAALICQLFGLAEFRETLILNHIALIVGLAISLWVSLSHLLRGIDQSGTWRFILLLAACFMVDLARFYLRGNSSGILYTITALVIFTIYRFAADIMKANRKAYTDAKTGLFNKNRWDELMKVPRDPAIPIGLMMLDLNRLKTINDTVGHEAGDKMIYNFANILRNTIPPSNTICRWGGDEFTVMITDASREKMERYTDAIAEAVEQYNASDEKPKIYYAAGWALSAEFPEFDMMQLLEKADQRMYQDKHRWYMSHTLD